MNMNTSARPCGMLTLRAHDAAELPSSLPRLARAWVDACLVIYRMPVSSMMV